jgi:hypothetical protein
MGAAVRTGAARGGAASRLTRRGRLNKAGPRAARAHLWRRVVRAAAGGLEEMAVVHYVGQPKVRDLDRQPVVEQQVFRLEVPGERRRRGGGHSARRRAGCSCAAASVVDATTRLGCVSQAHLCTTMFLWQYSTPDMICWKKWRASSSGRRPFSTMWSNSSPPCGQTPVKRWSNRVSAQAVGAHAPTRITKDVKCTRAAATQRRRHAALQARPAAATRLAGGRRALVPRTAALPHTQNPTRAAHLDILHDHIDICGRLDDLVQPDDVGVHEEAQDLDLPAHWRAGARAAGRRD